MPQHQTSHGADELLNPDVADDDLRQRQSTPKRPTKAFHCNGCGSVFADGRQSVQVTHEGATAPVHQANQPRPRHGDIRLCVSVPGCVGPRISTEFPSQQNSGQCPTTEREKNSLDQRRFQTSPRMAKVTGRLLVVACACRAGLCAIFGRGEKKTCFAQ